MLTLDNTFNNPYSAGLFANPTMFGPMMAGGVGAKYMADKDIGGSGNFFGNTDRMAGAFASGGLSEVGRALGIGGKKSKPYIAPMYGESTYGRPQTRFSMEGALSPSNTNAPTIGDYRTDMGIRPTPTPKKGLFQRRGSDINSTASPYSTHSRQNIAAFNAFNQDPNRRWTDTNGADIGGKQAYRYAWEQPGHQSPSQMLSVNPAEGNTLQQSAPGQQMTSSQPLSVESTGEGWGFDGNNAVASFGGTANPFYNANTQSYNNPSDMLWSNNSIPQKSKPFTNEAPSARRF